MEKRWNEHISIGFKLEDPPQQIRHLILQKQEQKNKILCEKCTFLSQAKLVMWNVEMWSKLSTTTHQEKGWSTIFCDPKFFLTGRNVII